MRSKLKLGSKRRPRSGLDFRALIKGQLGAMDKTVYWLSMTQKSRTAENVREYMRGDHDTTGESLAELFTLVGLDVTPI